LIDSVVPDKIGLRVEPADELWTELWVSLASLLRSYTSVHGLHANREAEIEWDAARILVRHGEKRLELRREDASVAWVRENGNGGRLELTEAGQLRRAASGNFGAEADQETTEQEEMDMAAERWARELMQ
jgi:hypothetical protein